jgi:hypothetical protein
VFARVYVASRPAHALVGRLLGLDGGDSLGGGLQAKFALAEILGLLRPADRFNLIAFGPAYHRLSRHLCPLTSDTYQAGAPARDRRVNRQCLW